MNADAMGIIFPNSYDKLVPELVAERLMASIPFAGRYRLIDFVLSSMVNSNIDNVSILVRENYYSLMDHLGSGREWDLTRKNGGLNIVPPYAEHNVKVYTGKVDALASILNFLKNQKERYVVMSDANQAFNWDMRELLNAHVESGADVTCAYQKAELPENFMRKDVSDRGLYYTFNVKEDGRIDKIFINSQEKGVQNICMNVYVIERKMLIEKIQDAFVRGYNFFERDILSREIDTLKVYVYEYKGYVARVSGMRSYFEENMKLLNDANLDALFTQNPIYTKIRDDNPTRYNEGAVAKNSLIADGCIIEGEVENSVLFRGVKVAKGAKVKNCILMQDPVVEENANVEYLITDKNVTVSQGKEVKSTVSFPAYVPKYHVV